MTTITLPDDLDTPLAEQAKQRGTTAEVVAVDALRKLFSPARARNGVTRGSPVESLIGLAAGSGPPPSDAEVDQWLADNRLEKYGS